MKFEVGDLVLLTDTKGRRKTIILEKDKKFFSHTGAIDHNSIIGKTDAIIVESEKGAKYLAIKPLLRDFTLTMPRGATIVYPKDAALIIGYADLYPGAKVLEAGVGSGALSASILRAIGPEGKLDSYERREEFALIARNNVEKFFGNKVDNWNIHITDVINANNSAYTHIILDMLEPWEPIIEISKYLDPGGVVTVYVATTTQLSQIVETLRSSGVFTEPESIEILLRPWHVDGLAVRPEHRMNGHTGFLVFARKMSDGHSPLILRRKFINSRNEEVDHA